MTVANEDQKFAKLVQTLAPHSQLVRTWPLNGGISAAMTAFEFADADGQTRRMILRRPGVESLKRNPQAAQDEFKLLQLTQAARLATPKPVFLDQTGTLFPTPFLVIDYIEGQPESAPAHLASFTRQMATHLAQIHRLDCARLDLAFLPQPPTSFAAIFGQRPSSVDPWFDEERIRTTLAAVWPCAQRNPSALLHGDFWPGNLLWQDGQLVAVIDWEDAHLGDPLKDLAVSRLDILCIFGPEALHSFTQSYQANSTLDHTDLPYWDLYAALRLLRLAGADFAAWAAFYPPFGRHDITEETIRAQYRMFVTQALEMLAAP